MAQGSTLATLMVVLGMDTTGVQAGTVKAQASLSNLATGAAKAFSPIGLGATAAGVAIGAFAAQSISAAASFDESFTRIASISNASAKEVEQWKGQVLSLAGETAQAPQELADALFFLASAGLKSSQVMETLEMSAKASAVGLGDTADIAKIVANALNAYASSGLTAAQATDTLVAAVREGSAEPDEFAEALGRILPIASQAGVEFDEVTASLAALSNIGLDVNEGVTAMRGLLTALAAPTKQSQEALANLGLTADDVRASLADRGLIGTLRMLEQRTHGNIDVMKELVPNVRSLTGVFGLTTQEAEKVDAIFRRVKESTGALSRAFETTSESDAFRLHKALNDLAILGQRFASDVLPGIVDALEHVVTLLRLATGQIDDFDDSMRDATIDAAAWELKIGGGFLKLVGGIPIIGDAVSAWQDYRDAQEAAAEASGLSEERLTEVAEAMRSGEPSFAALRENLTAQADAFLGVSARTGEAAEGVRGVAGAFRGFLGFAGDVVQGNDDIAHSARRVTEATIEERNAILALQGGLLGLVSQANSVQEAQAEVNRLQEHGKQGTEKYRQASLNLLQQVIGLKQGLLDYAVELDKQGKSSDQVVGKIKAMGERFGLTGKDVRDLIGDVRGLINTTEKVPSDVKIHLHAQDDATHTVVSLENRLNQLTAHDWELRLHMTTTGGSTAFDLINHLEDELEELTRPNRWRLNLAAGLETRLGQITSAISAAIGDGLSKAWLRQAKAFESMAHELATDIDRLQQRVERFADSIKSGFEIDLIGGLMGLDPESGVTPQAFLQQQVQQAQAFAAALKGLQAAGLAPNLLADLASRGVEALPLAQALLADPALLQSFEDAAGTIASIAESTSSELVEAAFGPALDRAAERMDRFVERVRDFAKALRVEAVEEEVDDLVRALRGLSDFLQGRGHAGGGGGGGGGAGFNPPGGGSVTVINQGTMIGATPTQLAQLLDEELSKKRKRNVRLAHH